MKEKVVEEDGSNEKTCRILMEILDMTECKLQIIQARNIFNMIKVVCFFSLFQFCLPKITNY